MVPGVVFCCCNPFASMFDMLCIQRANANWMFSLFWAKKIPVDEQFLRHSQTVPSGTHDHAMLKFSRSCAPKCTELLQCD